MAWKKIKLGEVLINREGRYKPNDILISNLKRIDKINFAGNIFLSNKGSNTDMILIKKGDLVISGINVEKGAISVYEGEEDICATIHYSSYIFNTNKIDIEFLKVFLRSPDFIQLLKEQVPGGIKTEIKPKHILPLEVYFPDSLDEQRRIANLFFKQEERFVKLKCNIEHQLTQIQNLNQAILQEAVQGKLVPQDPTDEPASKLLERIKAEKAKLIDSKAIKKGKLQEAETQKELLFDIPKEWIWCNLDDLCKNITDGTHQTPNYTNSGRIFLSAQNVKPFRFMPEDHKYVSEEDYQGYIKNRKPEKGDILIGRVGAGIGETAVIDKDLDFCIYVSLGLVQPFKEYISSEYLALVFNSPYGYKYAKGNISSKGGSAGNFNLGRIRSFLIPLPPLNEQKRIVAEIEKQLEKTKQLKEHILANQQATEQLLKALLHQAFEVEEKEVVA